MISDILFCDHGKHSQCDFFENSLKNKTHRKDESLQWVFAETFSLIQYLTDIFMFKKVNNKPDSFKSFEPFT